MIKSKSATGEEGFSRRDFLVKGGIVFGGSLFILQSGCAPIHRSISRLSEIIDLPSGVKEFEPNFWFQVLPDNRIRMIMPKCEMGQGIFTGFAMIAAEELDVDYEQIVMAPSSTTDPLDSLGTGGSTSTMSLYQPIREVAAQMKLMLLTAAAKIWNVKPETLTVSKGIISNGQNSISYIKTVEQTRKWKNPGKPTLKATKEFKIIGKDVIRNDAHAKITGEPIFGIDAEFPNMVYGMFVKTPFLEAIPKSIRTEKALEIKGVLQIIQENDFIVVVASNRYAAEMGARAVEVDWNIPKLWSQEELIELVTVGNGERSEIMKKGHPQRKMEKNSPNYFSADYRTAAGSHAQMEPNGAMAHYENGSVKIISGLQALVSFQKQVAQLLGIKEKNVYIQNTFLGGGFGRKSFYQDVANIALVSKLIGKPIHIFGDRTQEFKNGYLRPSTHHTFEVQQADDGKIIAINYQLATDNMLLSYIPKIAETLVGSDPASSHGARIGYDIDHLNTTYWKTKLPFNVGSWRGVGMYANTFAIESLMDELANKFKIDPIEFRIKHLNENDETDRRRINVLQQMTKELIQQAKTVDVGYGFACADDRKTIAATIAEVIISNGQIKVTRLITAVDAGKIINPEGVRQQIEGCAIMGIGATLMEKIEVQNGAISTSNFHEYPVPMLSDIPEIKVILVESGDHPFGVGEPPIAPISAAIANAVFNLTGKRLRSLPLNLEEREAI